MTIRQTILFSKAGNRLQKFERLAHIGDGQMTHPGADEMRFSSHVNSLKYGD